MPDLSRLIYVVSALLVCRLIVIAAVIPPWQQPDEHIHVAIAEVRRNHMTMTAVADPGREAEILRSMERYEWWTHYGTAVPDPMPRKFFQAGVGTLGINPTSNRPFLYYGLAGRVLSVLPEWPVVIDLYVLRFVSSVFALATLWVAWRGAREWLGDFAGMMVAILLALHPQFAVVATTASADAMVNLLGAFAWWQISAAIRRPRIAWRFTGACLAAVAASLADRGGVPLLATTFAASVVILWLRTDRGRWVGKVALCGALLCLMIGTAWVEESWWAEGRISGRLFPRGVEGAMTWDYFVRFSAFLFQSWWSSLGWTKYAPPHWWVLVVTSLTAVAAIGAVRRFATEGSAVSRALVLCALSFVTIQVAGEYWAFFRIAHGPQGRHLFPVLIPCLALLWYGLEAWSTAKRRIIFAGSAVVLFFLLDMVVLYWVAIPAFMN